MVDELSLQGIEQVDIAKAAGVTKGTVNQWISGAIKSVKLPYALGIEKAYGYNHRWLVMGELPKMAGDAQESRPDAESAEGQESEWPFPKISQEKLGALDKRTLLWLEAVLMQTASEEGLDILNPREKRRVVRPIGKTEKSAS